MGVTLPGALAREREADLGHGCQVAGPDPAELVYDRRRPRVQGGEDRVHDRRIDAGASDEELIRPRTSRRARTSAFPSTAPTPAAWLRSSASE